MAAIYAIKFKGAVVYVGQTKHNPRRRFNEHLSKARRGEKYCPKLYNHMRKYETTGYGYELLEEKNSSTFHV